MELTRGGDLDQNKAVWILFLVGFALIVWPLSIAIHEFAHAGAAKLLDIEVTRVQVGTGNDWRRWKWRGIEWVIGRQIYLGGYVLVTPPEGPWGRSRFAAMIAAGPLSNIYILAMCLLVLRTVPWEQSDFVVPMAIGLAWANGIVLYWSVVLGDVPIGDQVRPSDGSTLWQLLKDPTVYDEWLIARDFVKAVEADGRTVAEPRDAMNLQGRYAPRSRVEALFLRRMETIAPSSVRRLQYIDGFCTWALFTGDREVMARAEPWSEELFTARGGECTVWGTRGSMLLCTGRVQEGVALLERLMAEDKVLFDRAIGGCCLAWAAWQRGDSAACEQWRAEALRHNDGKPVIEWMEREMAQPATS
ncbi:MAG: M50 family metallopeptidase [Verrucomicrobiota bacterium]